MSMGNVFYSVFVVCILFYSVEFVMGGGGQGARNRVCGGVERDVLCWRKKMNEPEVRI